MNLVCDISFIDGSAVDSRNLDVFLPYGIFTTVDFSAEKQFLASEIPNGNLFLLPDCDEPVSQETLRSFEETQVV